MFLQFTFQSFRMCVLKSVWTRLHLLLVTLHRKLLLLGLVFLKASYCLLCGILSHAFRRSMYKDGVLGLLRFSVIFVIQKRWPIVATQNLAGSLVCISLYSLSIFFSISSTWILLIEFATATRPGNCHCYTQVIVTNLFIFFLTHGRCSIRFPFF